MTQTTMYCMICGAVAPCDAHTYHGQAPCRSNPMPETTIRTASDALTYLSLEYAADRLAAESISALHDEIDRLRLRLRKIANAPVPQTNEIAVMLTEWAQPRDGEVA